MQFGPTDNKGDGGGLQRTAADWRPPTEMARFATPDAILRPDL